MDQQVHSHISSLGFKLCRVGKAGSHGPRNRYRFPLIDLNNFYYVNERLDTCYVLVFWQKLRQDSCDDYTKT